MLEQERRQREKEEAAAREEAERLAQTPVHTPGDDGATDAAAIVPDVTAPEEPAADHITTTEVPIIGGPLLSSLNSAVSPHSLLMISVWLCCSCQLRTAGKRAEGSAGRQFSRCTYCHA